MPHIFGRIRKTARKTILAGAVSALALTAALDNVEAQEPSQRFDIAAQPLSKALVQFSEQTRLVVVAPAPLVEGKTAPSVSGDMAPDEALQQLLSGSGLKSSEDDSGAILITLGQLDTTTANRRVRVAQTDTVSEAKDTSGESDTSDDDEDKDNQEMDVIVVTGSNISGVGFGASPGFVFDKEDIDRSGFGTVHRFLESLPQNFGGGQNEDVPSSFLGGQSPVTNAVGANSINLRGLGSGTTLTLLNGRRIAPANLGEIVDTSMIPVSAIERVEVLTDGASAIYGSDAIAGVVNFVLRDDYEGAETSFRYGTVTDGSLREYRASQTVGFNWDSGNLLGVFEFYDRSNLGAEEREFSSNATLPRDLLPSQQRKSFLASGTQSIGDRLELSANVLFTDRETKSVSESFGPVFRSHIKSQQINTALGADLELSDDWTASITGVFSKSTSELNVTRDGGVPGLPDDFDSDLWSVEGKVDGSLFSIGAQDVRVAAGASLRKEEFQYTQEGVLLVDGDREVFAAFGEVFLPLISAGPTGIDRLEVTAAIRFEDYSDFGSTTDPKLGLLYSPASGITLRGTYGTSFRAPTLQNVSGSNRSFIFANIPDPTSPDGDTYTLFPFGGNPDLRPETATTWTAGVDIRPESIPELYLNVTYFSIDYKDRIGSPPVTSLFLVFDQSQQFLAPLIDRNPDLATVQAAFNDPEFQNFTTLFGPFTDEPSDVGAIFDFRTSNLAQTQSRGIDFSAGYQFDVLRGTANVNVAGTYILKDARAITSAAPLVSQLNTVFFPIDLRIRGSLGWARDEFTGNVFINYADGYTNNTVTPEEPLSSHTTIDLTFGYDVSKGAKDLGLLNGVRANISVINVFDNDPPFVDSPLLTSQGASVGFDPNNADPRGRVISVNLTKRW